MPIFKKDHLWIIVRDYFFIKKINRQCLNIFYIKKIVTNHEAQVNDLVIENTRRHGFFFYCRKHCSHAHSYVVMDFFFFFFFFN